MPDASRQTPSYEVVVESLSLLREKGLTRLRRLRLGVLQQAAAAAGFSDSEEPEPAAIEALVRRAVEALGGGQLGESAEYTFGLAQGTKGWPAQDRRKKAAEIWGVSVERFRKAQERTVIQQTAEEILKLCHEYRMRQTRMRMERRLPAESRLAVQWVERFEAYYRIWTPVGHLADDLRAALDTRHEPDLGHAPWDESITDYDPERQAQGYARFALFAYAQFKLELKKFMIRHGGMWLLSSKEVESQVADAVYRIGWHNPLNQEDDSWLRRTLSQAVGEEQEHFRHLLLNSTTGASIHREWQAYVASCDCVSNDQAEPDCQSHLTIQACDEYVRLIDEDWGRIADWYHPDEQRRTQVDGQQLYGKLLHDRSRAGEGRGRA